MNNYVIITDSTADLPIDIIRELGIDVVPLQFNIDGNEYKNYPDERGLDPKQFYGQLRAGKTASTSAINTADLIGIFEPYVKAGTDVLYIAFSSALSGTCNNSIIAGQELELKYPGRRILIVDSLCACMGEGLLVYLAVMEQKKGRNLTEVYDFVIANRLHLCHWFTVDDLNHLKRGGRLSATSALLGTLLGIKPILHVDDEGRLIPVGKTRGRRQSLEGLVDKMAQTAEDPGSQTVFISHGDCVEDARVVETLVRQRLKPKNVVIGYIGPVIGAHSGPGTVALYFLGSPR
jgi:DegV family protein with EDD domain